MISRIALLVVALCCLCGSTSPIEDLDRDGVPDLLTPRSLGPWSQCESTPAVRIGLVETGSWWYAEIVFHHLRYEVELIPPSSDLDVFRGFDVVYLPSSWAEVWRGDFGIIEEHAADYQRYVFEGGGLIVAQPNPWEQPGNQARPTLLPKPVTFWNPYDSKDWPPVIVDADHPITQNATVVELPGPADRVLNPDPAYRILTVGRNSGSPSLMSLEHGEGRILISGSSLGREAVNPVSEGVAQAMVEWVARL